MNNTSPMDPKTRKANYWNAQGVRHIQGDGKTISIDLAEKCFRNSVKFGGIIARYNLVLMISSGCIVGFSGELSHHLDILEDEGYITNVERKIFDSSCVKIDSDISPEDIPCMNLLTEDLSTIIHNGTIITMRMHLDSNLRTIIKKKKLYGKIDKEKPMTGDLIRVAKDNKLIPKQVAEELFDFARYVGSFHSEEYLNGQITLSDDKIKHWNDVINSLT